MKVPPPELPSRELHPDHEAYCDPASLERELRRVGEICHQCRRCLPLCPAFPKLFELVDATDREIEGVSMAGFDAVNELCFHCKLCYNNCPYTPDEHAWDVDFPKLMRRQQLTRTRRDGVLLTRRLTARTDAIGRVGTRLPRLLNLANQNRVSRWAMEKTLGIHRDWVQPSYHRETARRWADAREAAAAAGGKRVVLFATCSVNYSDPEVARATVEILERSGVGVEIVYEGCCGMPFNDTGELAQLRDRATRNVEALLPHVEAGAEVFVPGPSCSLLMKKDYPELLRSDAARRVAEATRDVMEGLVQLARAGSLDRSFARPLGRIAYHAPCHLRAQNVGFPAQRLLAAAGADVVLVDTCSGVDGTWGMQARFHEASLGVARKMAERIRQAGADQVATDCPLAALRIRELLDIEARHPVVVLRDAYGELT